MFKSLVILCVAFVSSCLSGAVITNVDGLAKAVWHRTTIPPPFELTADVIYRLEHEVGVMILLADGDRYVLSHYDPFKYDLRCREGDRIRTAGTIRFVRSDFGQPILTNTTLLGHAKIPDFQERRISSILNGECDWHPATVVGTVRNVVQSELSPLWIYLTLNNTDGGLYISIPKGEHSLSEFENLLGRRVRAKGFATPFDGSSRLCQGRIFQCSSLKNIQAINRPSTDPFDVPDVSGIQNRHPTTIAALGMHCSTGTVLAVWHPGNLLMQTANDQVLRVEVRDGDLPHAGQDIVAVGLPESDLFHVNLMHAKWRTTGTLPAVPAPVRDIQASTILRPNGRAAIDPSWHGRRIRLTGVVLGNQEDISRSRTMAVESGADVVTVNFGESAPRAPRSGSTVEVTGTCVLDIPTWRSYLDFPQITGFTLILDSQDGLKVLSTPSWWTPTRLLTVIGALLAALIAIVLWNASLRHIAERRGRELLREQIKGVQSQLQVAERTRLAVELHDSLAQALSGVALELETARALEDADKDAHLDIAAQALKSCRGELRNCLWDLRSEALDEPDMTKAILRTLQPQINDARLQVRFNVPRKRLSDTTAHALLRVIRELVINALRHGRASSVKVAGSLDERQLMFAVKDNGCGFDPDHRPGMNEGHFGLQGIQERIERIGGTVRIESAIGVGSKITVSLPVLELTKD